jgi:DegV family protein with EDD domain
MAGMIVRETALMTDSSCDLPLELLQSVGAEALPFPYTLDGVERLDDFGSTMSYKDFYDALDRGAVAHTSQVPITEYCEAFERATAQGKPVLLISLSSALSGTYGSAMLARERFVATHPGAEVHCVDSMCASSGEGLLVLEAADRLAEGLTAQQTAEWLEENKGRVHAVFTVNSFEHLVRGGRVSPAVGMVGAMLNINPVLHVDTAGRLVPLKKPRGRRRALEMLASMVAAGIEGDPDRRVLVSHGDCEKDAETLVGMLRERAGASNILVTRTGVIVGTHTGRGVVSVYYLGTPRTDTE